MKKKTFDEVWEDYHFRSRNNIPKLGFYSPDAYTIQEVKEIARSAWNASEINAGIYVDKDHHAEEYYRNIE